MQYIFQFVKNSFWVKEFILAREFGLNSNSNWCFHAVNCPGCREPGGLLGKTGSLCPSAGCKPDPWPGLHPARPAGAPSRPPTPSPELPGTLHQERRASGAQTPSVSQWGLQAQRATSWIPVFRRCWGGGGAYVLEPVRGRWVFPAWPATRLQGSGWVFMVQVKACLQTDNHIQTNRTRSQQPSGSTVSPSYCRRRPWVGVQERAGPRLVPRGQVDFVRDLRWRWEHKVLIC